MSVASKNLFAILDDDVGSDSQLDTPSAEPPSQEPAKANANQSSRGPASRGGRYYNRGGKSNALNSAADAAEENDVAPTKKYDSESPRGRGRGRGGRGGRGRGGGGDGGFRRGREYDRQSGTLPDSDKKVNQGWGGDDGQRALNSEQQAVADASVEGAVNNDWGFATPAAGGDDWAGTAATDDASGWDAPPATETAEVTSPATEAKNKDAGGGENRRRRYEEDQEEEDNTMTLEQYLAQRKDATVVPKLEETRKANEGSDESLWKNAVQVEKNSEDSYYVGKTKSVPKSRNKKTEKEVIEIEARFDRPDRGGRGRGRGGRGRGDRGGGRGFDNRGRNPSGRGTSGGGNIDVDDQSAFPSLS